MNGASVRPAHWIAFAIHPDDHEARPGHAASLTKPRQHVPVVRARHERHHGVCGGVVTSRNTPKTSGKHARKT